MKSKKKYLIFGFTLMEVMVSLFLSVMVSFSVYTMMISSYNAYNRISSVSKNANSIRFFITTFSNSIEQAYKLPDEAGGADNKILTFSRYDKKYGKKIEEKYFFEGGSELRKDATNSVSVTTITHHSETLGVLKRETIVDGKVKEKIIVSNIIRSIYYSITTEASGFKRMNIGVIYDDVVDGKVNTDTGKMEARADGATEMSLDTLCRRVFCFRFRDNNNPV